VEKLQPIINGIKKHHFWMVCVAAVGAIVGGIYLAFNEMPESFQNNKRKVEAKFADERKISSRNIAAESWPADAEKKGRQLQEELTSTAKQLQVGQESTWPAELGEKFAADAARLGRKGTWPAQRLEAYQKHAQEEFDRIVKIAEDVQWGEGVLSPLRDQFVWAAPITADVMFDSQEKLWVLEKILTSIAEVNKDAPDRLNLPVSAIEVLEIGPAALRTTEPRQIEMPGTPSAAAPVAAAPAGAAPANAPPGAAPPPGPAPGAAPPAPAPAVPAAAPPPPVPAITGLRGVPVHLRMRMNPDVFGQLETALLNSGRLDGVIRERVPIVIDDVHFSGEVKLVFEGGARIEPPARPGRGRSGSGRSCWTRRCRSRPAAGRCAWTRSRRIWTCCRIESGWAGWPTTHGRTSCGAGRCPALGSSAQGKGCGTSGDSLFCGHGAGGKSESRAERQRTTMSLESGEKQASGRTLPPTALQQAAAAKTAGSATKVRGSQPQATKGTAKSDVAEEAKKQRAAEASAKSASATAVAEPPEPVEDKKAAKARAKQEKAEAKARAKEEKAERKRAAKAERQRVASGGVKDIFILHVEKIVLGIAAAIALFMIYSALGKLSLPLNQSPGELSKKLDDVDRRVKTTPFPDAAFPIPTYKPTVDRFRVPIRSSALYLSVPWDPELVPKQKRDRPVPYPPVHPIATAGNGVFLVNQTKKAPEADRPKAGPAKGAKADEPKAKGAAGGAAPAPMGDAAMLLGGGFGQVPAPVVGDGNPIPLPKDIPHLGVAPPQAAAGVAGADESPIYPESRRWVVINALLPVEMQLAAYDKAFANAFGHDPSRDRPIYAEVRCLRLEVPPGTAESQLDWSKAKEWNWKEQLDLYRNEQRVWVLQAPEVVAAKFIRNDASSWSGNLAGAGLGVITKPLGPLVNQPWEPWASHPRLYEAPVVAEPAEVQEEAAAEPEAQAPAEPAKADPSDPFGFNKPAPKPTVKKQAAKKKTVATRPRPEVAGPVEYQLVRVFDFTVEPKKQYRYKLQLMLRNPNFGVKERDLQDPAWAKDPWLTTAWSEASNTVAVPDGQSVLAGGIIRPEPPEAPVAGRAAPPGQPSLTEVMARVVVKVLNFEAAQETFAVLTLRRGALVAGTADQFILNPLRRDVARKENANIHTDLVLADFHGGEKIEEGLEAPVEMLFINAAGQLVVQNSVQDEIWVKAVHKIQELFAEKAAPMEGEMGDPRDPANVLQKAAEGPAGRAKRDR